MRFLVPKNGSHKNGSSKKSHSRLLGTIESLNQPSSLVLNYVFAMHLRKVWLL